MFDMVSTYYLYLHHHISIAIFISYTHRRTFSHQINHISFSHQSLCHYIIKTWYILIWRFLCIPSSSISFQKDLCMLFVRSLLSHVWQYIPNVTWFYNELLYVHLLYIYGSFINAERRWMRTEFDGKMTFVSKAGLQYTP